MTQNASFIRKVIYGSAIVLLLLPIYLLGQPATRSSAGGGSPGGVLARLRTDYGLSQAELGEIDPASETMKMATLGLRGYATAVLWNKANGYKKKESWDKLSATLNQIAKLQPNYISVWEFQAHNLAYNVSSEFDNYRHRYHWVKKGLDFLIEGTKYNQRNPRLFWNLGWFTGHKIGQSDEKVQFREMFRNDTDFHNSMADYVNVDNARGPNGKPDNWLVAYLWYKQSAAVVDKGVPVTWMRIDVNEEGLTGKRRSSIIFYSDPSMALINHADAITGEIIPGEKTRNAWRRAGREWSDFGDIDVPTTYGHTIRLTSLDALREQEQRMRARLEALEPGLREVIRKKRRKTLSPLEEKIFYGDKKIQEMSAEDVEALQSAQATLTVTDMDVADALPDNLRAKGRYFARQSGEANVMSDRVSAYRGIVNYEYWATRSEVESSKTTADARRLMRLGDQEAKKANPDKARKLYEAAWDEWDKIFKKYPQLVQDVMGEDLKEVIMRYRLVLDQLDEEFPEDFKLKILMPEEPEEPKLQFPGGDPRDKIRQEETPTKEPAPVKSETDSALKK